MAAKKGYSAYEKKDKSADKKAGIKEGGKRDTRVDASKMRARGKK